MCCSTHFRRLLVPKDISDVTSLLPGNPATRCDTLMRMVGCSSGDEQVRRDGCGACVSFMRTSFGQINCEYVTFPKTLFLNCHDAKERERHLGLRFSISVWSVTLGEISTQEIGLCRKNFTQEAVHPARNLCSAGTQSLPVPPFVVGSAELFLQ